MSCAVHLHGCYVVLSPRAHDPDRRKSGAEGVGRDERDGGDGAGRAIEHLESGRARKGPHDLLSGLTSKKNLAGISFFGIYYL